jgi:hypothetical protein
MAHGASSRRSGTRACRCRPKSCGAPQTRGSFRNTGPTKRPVTRPNAPGVKPMRKFRIETAILPRGCRRSQLRGRKRASWLRRRVLVRARCCEPSAGSSNGEVRLARFALSDNRPFAIGLAEGVADCDIGREIDLDELIIAGRSMENHVRHRLVYAPLACCCKPVANRACWQAGAQRVAEHWPSRVCSLPRESTAGQVTPRMSAQGRTAVT